MNAFLYANAWLIITVVKVALLLFIVLTVNAYLTWFERKVVAHIQSRWGPHRVGPHGLLQPLADGLKFLFKEDPTPAGVDRFVYFLGAAFGTGAGADFHCDYSVWAGSFALENIGTNDLSGNFAAQCEHRDSGFVRDYRPGRVWSGAGGVVFEQQVSVAGGLRSSAQMISYELALTLSVVGVLLIAGTFNLTEIINDQTSRYGILGWNIFPQFLGFICFFIAAVAETNRVPFDLPEAESELVAGFHTEYASFKFAMFFIAEYTSMITVSCLCAILFFGGWLSPFPATWTWTYYLPTVLLLPAGLWVIWDGLRYETIFGKVILPGIGAVMCILAIALVVFPGVNNFIQAPFWLLSKIFVFLFVYVWMRGTLPRLRYDQLMAFGWKMLLPVSIANVVITSFAILKWGAMK